MTSPETMIERCAKAMHDGIVGDDHNMPSWDVITPASKKRSYDGARAVLLALREPSAGMLKAGRESGGFPAEYRANNTDTVTVFAAMIDAALAENP